MLSSTAASCRPPSLLMRRMRGPCALAAATTPTAGSPRPALQHQGQHHEQHRRRCRRAATIAASSSFKSRASEALGGDLLPQNSSNPLALPNKDFTALQAVALQLDALSAEKIHFPRAMHGVDVAYAFCADSGSLEMSRYFAPLSTSLYHQDHFQGKFLTRFCGLVGHKGWEAVGEAEEEEGVAVVRVRVAPSSSSSSEGGEERRAEERHTYVFVMVRQEAGLRQGAWVTKQLVRLGEDGAPVVGG